MCKQSDMMRDRQRTIRKQLDARGVSLKAVSFDSGIPYSTLCTYFPGNERGFAEKKPAEMPVGAFYSLFGAIDDDLLNLLLPEGYAVVQVPRGIDYDAISELARDFIDAKDRAHHPESEAGRDIGPNEEADLGAKVVRLKVRA